MSLHETIYETQSMQQGGAAGQESVSRLNFSLLAQLATYEASHQVSPTEHDQARFTQDTLGKLSPAQIIVLAKRLNTMFLDAEAYPLISAVSDLLTKIENAATPTDKIQS